MRSRIEITRRVFGLVAALGASSFTMNVVGAATLVPNASFGGGDGWRAPFEVLSGDAAGSDSGGLYRFLGDAVTNTGVNPGNIDRGFAFNPVTGNLVLVSRASGTDRIRILDGTTGVDKGSLNQTGVTGGSFAMNTVGVADDGVIYMGNMSTNLTTSPFKVYRWTDETAAPTVAFTGGGTGGTPMLAGARLGDSFDVYGSGVDTKFVAGYGTSASIPETNGFASFSTTDGLNFTSTNVVPTAVDPLVTPASGTFRYGITFTDGDTVVGKSDTNHASFVDVNGAAGTVTTQISTDGALLRPMDYAIIDGRPILAMMEASIGTTDPARARLFVYDMSDPSLPLADRKIAEASALPGPQQANINAAGSVKFGPINGNTATIYALNTNNGIQAFTLTLDLPTDDDADFNGDSIVDGSDFLIWQRGLGSSDQLDKSTGDADGNGMVNDADLAIWTQQFGTTTTPPAVGAVPEPGALGLAAVALACLAACRRKN